VQSLTRRDSLRERLGNRVARYLSIAREQDQRALQSGALATVQPLELIHGDFGDRRTHHLSA
jgi:hypothetical protein